MEVPLIMRLVRRLALCVSLTLVTVALSSVVAEADSPSLLKIFRPSTVNEKASEDTIQLKAEHGPWLILATSFEGAEALSKAGTLAQELRSRYQLDAYVLSKQFDFSQSTLGNGIDAEGKQRRMKYATDRKIESAAVLIGDFDSFESPKLKETVERVKTLQPECLGGKSQSEPEHSIASFKLRLRASDEDKSKANGPMVGAFVTRNPLLPEDFFQPPSVDKFVQSLNKNADHSLLKSKSRFTVRVATFRGADAVVLAGSRSAQEASSSAAGDGLELAAFRANLAAKTLRAAGIEAYEFHDRNHSIVTVGSFDSLGAENNNGQFAYASDIVQTMNEFGGAKEYRTSQFGPTPVPKTLLDVVNYKKIPELLTGTEAEKARRVKQYSIPFDLDPKPMAVPRAATNKLYAGSLLGRN
jgi:hypothetical protein